MEYSEINVLSKWGTDDYDLWSLTLPREKIHEIRQAQDLVSGDMRQVFEGLPLADEKERTFHFVLPHEDGLRLVPVDMGEGFADRNRYNGSSVRGSREEIMEELRENLRSQGYDLRPNAAFVDVDIIATLQKIMEHNTDFYKTDFQYDVEKLREAAEDRGGCRGFFWLSRKSGTWCFPEQDVYIRGTSAANTWIYYGGSRGEHVKAYWVGLKQVEGDDRKIIGDVVEMDYQKHLDYLCTHSFEPAYVEVVFKSPNSVRTFTYGEYQENWHSISQRYGTVERVKYCVENQQEFARAVLTAQGLIWDAARPMEIDNYIGQLEHNRLHDYGYTADDLQRVGPLDAEMAVKHGLKCYALHGDGTREPVADLDVFQKHLFHDGMFGMSADERELLRYFGQTAVPLFDTDELRRIYHLVLQAGMRNEPDTNGLLERIVYKAERVLSAEGRTPQAGQELDAGQDGEEKDGLWRDS